MSGSKLDPASLTVRQTADMIDQVEQLAGRLRTLEPAVRRRAEMTDRDGYPRTSAPGNGHSRGGDPVGALVAVRVDGDYTDPIRDAHHTMLRRLADARRLLEQAESEGHKALPPATVHPDGGCTSCARIGQWSPICRTGRCRWCSDWAYSHSSEDPPIDILRAHHEGRRITTHVIETSRSRRR